MRLVIIESPYAGDVERNVAYAKAAVRDCLQRGEAPYASHLFFPQAGLLNDDIPAHRAIGIEAGLAWGAMADATVVYEDLGISVGMALGILRAQAQGRPVELRRLRTFLPAAE
ncbi:hypothetical protein [Methylobacterium sp. WL19]|uniref:DUF7768 domain-containing protein n=1 Tax=Methylobacterium sp. WL19 TaxID=2603896 RepID=UPI0011C97538|nr:hypothetical protein [Methylobacterium sp. WL19]TXN26854.1 hypothetical protein FV220_13520 [Methylobacterium sp. WL19]